MKFDVISSGSKGNSTIVISGNKALILDCGISKKRIVEALNSYNLSLDDVEAMLITHTHSDHASNCYSFPLEMIYCSSPIIPKIDKTLPSDKILTPFEVLNTDSFKITCLPVSHDCKNTLAFLIEDGKESLVYLTDTGFVPEKDFLYLKDKEYYIFESNHDTKMLYESKRSEYLIRRIISDKGHLSNTDSAYYLSIFIGDKTKEVVLSHLSSECNTEELALNTFKKVTFTQLGYTPNVILKCGSETRETRGGEE